MYQFLYEKNPAPKTVQRTREAIERVRDGLIKDHGSSESYWTGQIDALTNLIDELFEFEQRIKSPKRTGKPEAFGKG